MMPQLDGIAATAKLREKSNVPIILLTAKSESSDKVLGLNIGADDYITKPLTPWRCWRASGLSSAVTRSWGRKGRGEAERLHRRPHRARRGEKKRDGRRRRGRAHAHRVQHPAAADEEPGRIYSSAQIYEACVEGGFAGAETSVSVHIRHLRQKLEINPSEPRYLKVVWGLGYKMEDKK